MTLVENKDNIPILLSLSLLLSIVSKDWEEWSIKIGRVINTDDKGFEFEGNLSNFHIAKSKDLFLKSQR